MAIKDAKNILIINLGGMGDLLLSVPSLRALRRLYPDAFVSALVTETGYEIAKDLSCLSDVCIFYMGSSGKMLFWKMPQNIRTVLSLRRKRFDMAINMRTLASGAGAFKIRILLGMINPEVSVGRNTGSKGDFFDIKIPETNIGEKYEMDYDLETVKALGADVTDRQIDFRIDEKSLEKVRHILNDDGVSAGDVVIGVHIGGKASHRWPARNFMEAIKHISERINCRIAITGEREDTDVIEELAKEGRIRVINMAGRLSVSELGALIKMCSLYISNDTAPMHIAAVLKTPLVAIFGPGYLTRFNPRNLSDKSVVLYKKTDCAPCDRITCRSMACLKSILPQEVSEAAFNLLNREGKIDA